MSFAFCVAWFDKHRSPGDRLCNHLVPDTLEESEAVCINTFLLIFTLFMPVKQQNNDVLLTSCHDTPVKSGAVFCADAACSTLRCRFPSISSYQTHFVDLNRPPHYWCWSCWGSCCPLHPAGGAGGSQTPALWRRSHISWNTTTQISETEKQRDRKQQFRGRMTHSVKTTWMFLFSSYFSLVKIFCHSLQIQFKVSKHCDSNPKRPAPFSVLPANQISDITGCT